MLETYTVDDGFEKRQENQPALSLQEFLIVLAILLMHQFGETSDGIRHVQLPILHISICKNIKFPSHHNDLMQILQK